MSKGRGRRGGPTAADAELLAAQALLFIAQDADRLADFLALTGLDVRSLRESAGAPGFSRGIMAHVMADEALLVAFAAHQGLPPEEVARTALTIVGHEGG